MSIDNKILYNDIFSILYQFCIIRRYIMIFNMKLNKEEHDIYVI